MCNTMTMVHKLYVIQSGFKISNGPVVCDQQKISRTEDGPAGHHVQTTYCVGQCGRTI